MRTLSRMDPLQVWYAETKASDFIDSLPKSLQKKVKKRIEKMTARSGSEYDFPRLSGSTGGQIRITDHPPIIFHPETANQAGASALIHQIFHTYRESLSADRRLLLDRYSLIDFAIKVVGVRSAEHTSELQSPIHLAS